MFRGLRKNLFGTSVRHQLIAGVTIVHMILMSIFVYDLVHRQRTFLLEKAEQWVLLQAELIATTSINAVASSDLVAIEELMLAFGKDESLRYALITDTNGLVLGHTDKNITGKFVADSVSEKVLTSVPKTLLSYRGEKSFEASSPIILNGKLLGWARASRNLTGDYAHLAYVTHSGIFYTLIAIFIGIIFALGLASGITNQIRILMGGIKRINAGETILPLEIVTDNELGTLTSAFNTAIESQRKSQTELESRETQLRIVTDAIPFLVAFVDKNRRYRLVNKAFETWFDLSSADCLNQTMLQLLGEKAYDGVRPFVDRAFQGETINFETVVPYKFAGTRNVRVMYTPTKNRDGTIEGIVILVHDVTKERKADEERNKILVREQTAITASTAKSEFLANMSHEIRTPINGVIGMTALLFDTSLNDEQRDYANSIQCSAETLLTVINDILDFSKIESGKLDFEQVDFDLISVINETVKNLAFAAQKKNIEIQTSVSELVARRVNGDPGRLRQVLTNLLGNAIKFTPSGSISVRVSAETIDLQENKVRFEVEDQGIGISEEAKSRLFKAFSQADASTSRRFGGTGLGLSICKQLTERMGGQIGVNSTEGKGATFWFTAAFGQVSSPHISLNDSETVAQFPDEFSKLRILVAEDNFINQKIAIKMLEKMGLHGHIAASGTEVLHAMRRTSYDLILMDCQMPEMDGYEATRAIRGDATLDARNIPIIAMTANALKGDRERCLEAGMSDYVSKPISAFNLAQVIAKWLKPNDATDHKVTGKEPNLVIGVSEESVLVNEMNPAINLKALEPLDSLSEITDKNLVCELIESFFNQAIIRMTDLHNALSTTNGKALEFAAHNLKSSCASLGAESMAAICQDIENHGAAGDVSKTESLLVDLEREFKRVKPQLQMESRRRKKIAA